MVNFTSNTYQMKREILTFSKKISAVKSRCSVLKISGCGNLLPSTH